MSLFDNDRVLVDTCTKVIYEEYPKVDIEIIKLIVNLAFMPSYYNYALCNNNPSYWVDKLYGDHDREDVQTFAEVMNEEHSNVNIDIVKLIIDWTFRPSFNDHICKFKPSDWVDYEIPIKWNNL